MIVNDSYERLKLETVKEEKKEDSNLLLLEI